MLGPHAELAPLKPVAGSASAISPPHPIAPLVKIMVGWMLLMLDVGCSLAPEA